MAFHKNKMKMSHSDPNYIPPICKPLNSKDSAMLLATIMGISLGLQNRTRYKKNNTK